MITFDNAWNQVENDKIVLQGIKTYNCATCGDKYVKNDNNFGVCDACYRDIQIDHISNEELLDNE